MTIEYIIICLLVVAVILLGVKIFIVECDLKTDTGRIAWHLEQIMELRKTLAAIESRTALYKPKKVSGGYGTSGGPIRTGYSLTNEYVGLDTVINMLMSKLGLSLHRTMVSEEFYLLDEKAGGSCVKAEKGDGN